MRCVFCDIIAGRTRAAVVYEDEHVVGFFDHQPLFPGHVLLVPRRHAVTLPDLEPEEIAPLFGAARLVARAVPRSLGAQGTFVAINNKVSQTVFHLHVHVVPRTKGDGLKGFFWPRNPYRDEAHTELLRAALAQSCLQEEILDFWFGPLDEHALPSPRRIQRWFAAQTEFDEQIRQRFERRVQDALSERCDAWAGTPQGRLALILLLDQFTRNLHRRDARAFSGDAQALRLCLEGLERGQHLDLALDERAFFYLPLEHSEDRTMQERCVSLYQELACAAPTAARPRFENYLQFALQHQAIIERFGRYPHRNDVLGRATTAEEKEFLAGPRATFW